MTDQRVMFLNVPVQGQPAQVFMNGQAVNTANVVQVLTKDGWYWATTADNIRYVGQLQAAQQPQPTQQPQAAYPQQQVPAKKKTNSCAAIAIVVVGFLVVMGIIGSQLPDSKTDTTTSSATVETPAVEPEKPDFELRDEDWAFENGEYGTRHIVGTATNNTDETFSYVQVEFNLYDASGAQVGSTMANCNNVEPHSKWKFDAIVMEDNATTAKFKGFSKF